jgi:hypothetical protein
LALVGAPFNHQLRLSCDWPADRQLIDQARLQCRLKKFLTSRPEMISAKDNLVGGMVVAALRLATAGVLANGGWSTAT